MGGPQEPLTEFKPRALCPGGAAVLCGLARGGAQAQAGSAYGLRQGPLAGRAEPRAAASFLRLRGGTFRRCGPKSCLLSPHRFPIFAFEGIEFGLG